MSSCVDCALLASVELEELGRPRARADAPRLIPLEEQGRAAPKTVHPAIASQA